MGRESALAASQEDGNAQFMNIINPAMFAGPAVGARKHLDFRLEAEDEAARLTRCEEWAPEAPDYEWARRR